jgi:hypothetical protein
MNTRRRRLHKVLTTQNPKCSPKKRKKLGLTMNKQQEAAVKQCMFSYTFILYINIQKWPKHMKSLEIM